MEAFEDHLISDRKRRQDRPVPLPHCQGQKLGFPIIDPALEVQRTRMVALRALRKDGPRPEKGTG